MTTAAPIPADRAAAARRLAVLIVVATAACAAATASSALGGDFGPNTCLNGFVWREANTQDTVCVTPDIRTQTRQENALAASRRNPNGGAFGPDTCLQGFVWREAFTSDHVCVPPSSRDQARSDNAHADERRDEIRTKTAVTASRWTLRIDRINVGQARVILYRSSRRPIRGWVVSVPSNPTAPGGLVTFKSGVRACSGAPNAYFKVTDVSSGRARSVRVCATI